VSGGGGSNGVRVTPVTVTRNSIYPRNVFQHMKHHLSQELSCQHVLQHRGVGRSTSTCVPLQITWLPAGVAVAVAGMAAYGAVAISQPVPGHSSTPTVRAPFLKAVPAGSITGQRSSLEAGQSEGGGIPAAAPLPASTAT
jgi:hypothetical protein